MRHFEFTVEQGRKKKDDKVIIIRCKTCGVQELLWIRAVLQLVRELKANETRINPHGSYQFVWAINQALYTDRDIDDILAPFHMKREDLF